MSSPLPPSLNEGAPVEETRNVPDDPFTGFDRVCARPDGLFEVKRYRLLVGQHRYIRLREPELGQVPRPLVSCPATGGRNVLSQRVAAERVAHHTAIGFIVRTEIFPLDVSPNT